MRTPTIGVAVLLAALLAACGGGSDQASDQIQTQTPGQTASPDTGTEQEPDAEATEQPAGASEGTSGAATSQPGSQDPSSQQAQTPQEPPPAGGVNVPKPGKYLYVSSGQQGAQPPATPTTYEDRETTVEYLPPKQVEGGTEVKYRAGSEQGTSTTTSRWEQSRILLQSVSFSSPQGQIECRFNTPQGGLEIARIPMKAEKFQRQEWSNDTCEGWHDQEVVRQETVTVPSGSYETWVVQTTTHIKLQFSAQGGGPIPGGPQQVETTVAQTQWVSPQLGLDVKSDGTNEFKFGTQSSKGESTRELKTTP